MQKKNALICGVSGQDGAYLAQLLLANGYRVFGTSRDAQTTSFKNLISLGIRDQVTCFSMAPNDFRSVLQVLKRVDPDEIYNLAGQSSVSLSFDQPVETMESIAIGTLNLLEGIRFLDSKAKLYNAGSSECFGNTAGALAIEDTPFRPRSPYAFAKSASHWEVANYREAYQLFACTGIMFNHESPLRPKRFVTRKIVATACRIACGSTEALHLGNIDVIRDWGWAPEYVKAMWLMLQQDEPADYVIATGTSHSLREFVETVFRSLDLDWQKCVTIDPTLLRPTDIAEGRANPKRAETELGWKATKNMEDVISELIRSEMSSQKEALHEG